MLKTFRWQLVVTILVTTYAFWMFRQYVPIHAVLNSPEFVGTANGPLFALFPDVATLTHPLVDFLVALPMCFLTVSYLAEPAHNTPTAIHSWIWQLAYPSFFMSGGAFGLLFAAAQGWGAALLIYPVMGIALAIPAALVGLVAGIADTWQRRQS